MFVHLCRDALGDHFIFSPHCNNSPRKQSGLLRRVALQSYAASPGRHQDLIRLLSKRAEGEGMGGSELQGDFVESETESERRIVCVCVCVLGADALRCGGQCKCYCCVSSFDQSPGKVKRIQSGFVWQSGDTGAGEETPRTENGLSYWCWSSRGLRRTVYSARNAFRQQLALITFIDFSGSVPRI